MRIGDEVQNAARPRSIHAAEEDVAIERRAKAFFFADTVREWAYCERLGSGAAPKGGSKDVYLRSAHIGRCGVQKSVEINNFDSVKIDQRNTADSRPRKCFGNQGANTAGTNDSEVQPRQIGLSHFAPRRQSSP